MHRHHNPQKLHQDPNLLGIEQKIIAEDFNFSFLNWDKVMPNNIHENQQKECVAFANLNISVTLSPEDIIKPAKKA